MMLGSPIPVQLPYDSSEDRLIVRRQNKLARDIDIIQQKTEKHVTVGVVDPGVIRILTTELPYQISQQLFNVQLKEICRLAGINEPVKAYKTCEKTRIVYRQHYDENYYMSCFV